MTIVIFLSVLTASGCASIFTREPKPAATRIRLKGSQTINQELGPKLAKGFKDKYGIEVEVEAKGTGSGFKALEEETCEIAAASERAAEKEEKNAAAKGYGLNSGETVIGYDAIVVLVNKNNRISALTKQQLKDIFTGKTTQWSQLDPNLSADTIHLAIPADDHGTHKYFKRDVLENESFGFHRPFANTLEIDTYVAGDDNAIGFASFTQVKQSKKLQVKTSERYQYVSPDSKSIAEKTYPLTRELYLYTRGKPEGAAKQFIEYTASPEGQRLVGETGFIAFSPDVRPEKDGGGLPTSYLIPFDSNKAAVEAGKENNEGIQRIELFIRDYCSPYGGASVEVVGHSDKRGTEQRKQDISQQRAEKVKEILETRCQGLKVSPLWASDRQQIDEGDSAEALAKNRRAEIRVKLK